MSVSIRCKEKMKTVLFDEQDRKLLGDLKFHINVSTGYAQHNRTKAYMHRIVMGNPKGDGDRPYQQKSARQPKV